MAKTKYFKMIEFEKRELETLELLLKRAILNSDDIFYIVKNVPLYQKIYKEIAELEKIEVPF